MRGVEACGACRGDGVLCSLPRLLRDVSSRRAQHAFSGVPSVACTFSSRFSLLRTGQF